MLKNVEESLNVEESTQSTVIITRLVLNKMCFAAVVKQLLMLLSGDPRVDDVVVVAVVVVLGILSPPVLETLDSEEEDCETQSSQENCQTREECER